MSPKLRPIQQSSLSWILCSQKCLTDAQPVLTGSVRSTKLPTREPCRRNATLVAIAKSARSRSADPAWRTPSQFKSRSFERKPLNHEWNLRELSGRRSSSTSSASAAPDKERQHGTNETSAPADGVSLGTTTGSLGLGAANRTLEQWTKNVSVLLSTVTYGLTDMWKSKRSTSVSSPSAPGRSSDAEVVASPGEAVPDRKAKVVQPKLPIVSMASLDARTRFLVRRISSADSNMAHYSRIEELGKLLQKHPETQTMATKVGAVRQLMLAKQGSADPSVHEAVHEVLALLGYCSPPSGWGVRILSIDGGGLRGVMALEILEQLEELTGQPVHKMFDYICGVSTGAILAILLGALKSSVPRCEDLYRQIGSQIFTQNALWGTSKLVLNHAYYDTATWTQMVREHIGERLLCQTARDPACPKFSAISTVVSRPRLEAFLFRNYDYPPRVRSVYPGTNVAQLWEAIRASAAAPGYFEEYAFGDEIHQDGGILINNPTALALHECKQLWPGEAIQCIISLGSGRYEPQHAAVAQKHTGLKDKVMKIIDSATDTEAVHTILHDLLPPNVYFRINPYLSENIPLHEARPEKIVKLQEDARMYLRRNENKLRMAASLLKEPRGRLQSVRDFVSLKSSMYFG